MMSIKIKEEDKTSMMYKDGVPWDIGDDFFDDQKSFSQNLILKQDCQKEEEEKPLLIKETSKASTQH